MSCKKMSKRSSTKRKSQKGGFFARGTGPKGPTGMRKPGPVRSPKKPGKASPFMDLMEDHEGGYFTRPRSPGTGRTPPNRVRPARNPSSSGFMDLMEDHEGGSYVKNPEGFLQNKPMMPQTDQNGGSPAYDVVMGATTQPPVTNDYFPRTSDNSGCQAGGAAYDMVMSNLNENTKTVPYPEGFNVKGDINSLNTYEISGGRRTNKKHKKHNSKKHMSKKHMSKKHKSKKHMSKKNKNSKTNKKNNHINNMKGGYGSAWIASQYSLGNINNAGMNTGTNDFSSSQGVSRDILMNPPTLGLAGSGYAMGKLEGANTSSVGAPLV